MPDYSKTLNYAEKCKQNVEKKYALGVSPNWCYYFAKQILNPKTSVKQIPITAPSQASGDYISRQIFKSSYMDMAERVVKFVEKNHQIPTNVKFTTQNGKTYKIHIRDVIYMFSRIIVYYDTNKAYPKYANVTSKSFTKPTENTDSVYDYFVKVFGKVTCIDDAMEKIAGRGYGYYYDDVYSNKQSIDRIKNRQGVNCTDATQMMKHVADGTGKYKKIDCVHVKCRGGDGHVYLKITQKDGSVFYRDPAAVLDSGDITRVWCSDGTVLAINPSWWTANLQK